MNIKTESYCVGILDIGCGTRLNEHECIVYGDQCEKCAEAEIIALAKMLAVCMDDAPLTMDCQGQPDWQPASVGVSLAWVLAAGVCVALAICFCVWIYGKVM